MNGHLLRCRPQGTTAASPSRRRSWLGATSSWRHSPHVRPSTLRCGRSLHLATHLHESKCRKSPKGAFGPFLTRLQHASTQTP